MYHTIERGSRNTSSYRIYLGSNGRPLSPCHDIPLIVDSGEKVYNMIVEIPRWTNAKMEISLGDLLNPIKQDEEEGKLRNIPNCFPYHGIPWNYGALPQTLEDPNALDKFTTLKGDGDPVDVIEIGQRLPSCGEVLQVKVLGALALIDRNKIDWKVIALSTEDEYSSLIEDLDDVDRCFPTMINSAKEWFNLFKVVAGKPENKFFFNGEVQRKEVAHEVIESAHNYWKKVVSGSSTSGICTANVTLVESPCYIDVSSAEAVLKASPVYKSPHSKDPTVDVWHFVDQK